MEPVAVIVPALERNTYHSQGDLAPFGDVSLLEWKLTQLRAIGPEARIYLSTPSAAIADWADRQGLRVIRRSPDLTLPGMIQASISSVDEEEILWANVTSPFVSAGDYRAYLRAYRERPPGNDSLLTVIPLHEYVFHRGAPVNFVLHEHRSRRDIEPLMVVANGCFIIGRERALALKSFIGEAPMFQEVDRLTAMEIKDLEDLNIANDLLTRYMRTKELA